MTEAADPLVIAVCQRLVFPTESVSDLVVVATEGDQLLDAGLSAFCPRDAVVEVAISGRHSTTWEDAGGVATFDLPALSGGGSPAGDAVVDGLAGVGVGDGPPPYRVGLLFSHLAGDVGNDRTVSR
jgi:hypothetical protein